MFNLYSEITGDFELDIVDIRNKLGSMSESGQCCASGTCDIDDGGGDAGPLIKIETDTLDPRFLFLNYGAL